MKSLKNRTYLAAGLLGLYALFPLSSSFAQKITLNSGEERTTVIEVPRDGGMKDIRIGVSAKSGTSEISRGCLNAKAYIQNLVDKCTYNKNYQGKMQTREELEGELESVLNHIELNCKSDQDAGPYFTIREREQFKEKYMDRCFRKEQADRGYTFGVDAGVYDEGRDGGVIESVDAGVYDAGIDAGPSYFEHMSFAERDDADAHVKEYRKNISITEIVLPQATGDYTSEVERDDAGIDAGPSYFEHMSFAERMFLSTAAKIAYVSNIRKTEQNRATTHSLAFTGIPFGFDIMQEDSSNIKRISLAPFFGIRGILGNSTSINGDNTNATTDFFRYDLGLVGIINGNWGEAGFSAAMFAMKQRLSYDEYGIEASVKAPLGKSWRLTADLGLQMGEYITPSLGTDIETFSVELGGDAEGSSQELNYLVRPGLKVSIPSLNINITPYLEHTSQSELGAGNKEGGSLGLEAEWRIANNLLRAISLRGQGPIYGRLERSTASVSIEFPHCSPSFAYTNSLIDFPGYSDNISQTFGLSLVCQLYDEDSYLPSEPSFDNTR